MTLPDDVDASFVSRLGYANTTHPSDALGVADHYYYSLGAGGDITIDMGADFSVTDGLGDDFVVVSGTQSEDAARVYVGSDQDGPFAEVAFGTGDLYVDLGDWEITSARYIKVVDESDVLFHIDCLLCHGCTLSGPFSKRPSRD